MIFIQTAWQGDMPDMVQKGEVRDFLEMKEVVGEFVKSKDVEMIFLNLLKHIC